LRPTHRRSRTTHAAVAPPYHPPLPTRRSSDLVVNPDSLLEAMYIHMTVTDQEVKHTFMVSNENGQILLRQDSIMNFGMLSLSGLDRKSARLNSSHVKISYAVFCLKKKRKREYA